MARSTATLQAKPSPKPAKVETRHKESHRDTVEAIVVAFILALVVRGFEAQAFVIPTGSMAPTLMGRHKETSCPQCGHTFAVNASDEVEPRLMDRDERSDPRVYAGVCDNCRYEARLDELPSFKGDRILVMMFPYDLPFLPGSRPPERWDVVVFRYPEEPEVSYIKRLIGKPGETVRIVHGDVYVKVPGSDSFVLARKPLRHQSAMQINVYDDRHRPRAFAGLPQWLRWQTSASGWQELPGTTGRYETTGATHPGGAELRYRHLVPEPDQWKDVLSDSARKPEPRATLITDFYAYNTNQTGDAANFMNMPFSESESAWMQPHWVGDLTLEASLEIKEVSKASSLGFELIKAGVPHRCIINLETGSAIFTRGEAELGRCDTVIKGPGRFHVQFANVDDRVSLIVNGRPVGGEGFEYDVKGAVPIPTAADLAPAAITVWNAGVVASDLVLKRDIYYTQAPRRPGEVDPDYAEVWGDRNPRNPTELFDFLSDPSRFPRLAKVRTEGMDYKIGDDHYMMLGDNSPKSSDSRAWGSRDARWDPSERRSWEVPRKLVTGKAFYIYWPHGVPIGPEIAIGRDMRLLFRPYFERMKWIR